MKLYFISNILPMEVIHKMNRSVAGAQFQVSLAKALDEATDGDTELLSIVRQGNAESKKMCDRVVFGKKQHDTIVHINKPFVEEICVAIQVLFKGLFWSWKNRTHERKILVMNAPNEVMTPMLLLQKLGLCSVYSFVIDSPFVKTGNDSVYLRWRKKDYEKGLKKLNQCKGVILLNANVVKILNLTNPTKTILLGFENNTCKFDENHYIGISKRKKRLMYAGTFSYVNGIKEMLSAFSLLEESQYQIDICGYGPEEELIEKFCEKHKNCVYYGRVSNEKLDDLYSKADLLLNIRLPDDEANNFSFPSKLIGYMYSGTAVVSSDFSSLPDSYREFLYITKNVEPDSIAETINNVFLQDEAELNQKAKSARDFIEKNQNWTAVGKSIIEFIESN